MAMAHASWPGTADFPFKPPLTLTMDSSNSINSLFTDGRISPSGSDLFDDIDGRDAFPVAGKPTPAVGHLTKDALWASDPTLCITPEKDSTRSRFLSGGKSVRFNPHVEVRSRSDENRLSAGRDAGKAVDVNVSSRVAIATNEMRRSLVERPQVNAASLDESLGPISVLASDLQHGQVNSGSALSKSPPDIGRGVGMVQKLPTVSSLMAAASESAHGFSTSNFLGSRDMTDRVTVSSAISELEGLEESDAQLAKPGLNSSRWVTTELRRLQENDPDVDQVLREKLASSSRLRNEITEKVRTHAPVYTRVNSGLGIGVKIFLSLKVFVVPPSELIQNNCCVVRCSILGNVLLIYSKRLFWTSLS